MENKMVIYDGRKVKLIQWGVFLSVIEFVDVFKGQRMRVQTSLIELA